MAVPDSTLLFNMVQKNFKTIGIYPSQSRGICLCNSRYLFLVFSFIQMIFSSLAYLIFQADTADQYGISFYVTITILTQFFQFVIITQKMPKILNLIEDYKAFVLKSKLNVQ